LQYLWRTKTSQPRTTVSFTKNRCWSPNYVSSIQPYHIQPISVSWQSLYKRVSFTSKAFYFYRHSTSQKKKFKYTFYLYIFYVDSISSLEQSVIHM
jgi:hypothetical protein